MYSYNVKRAITPMPTYRHTVMMAPATPEPSDSTRRVHSFSKSPT